MTQSHNDSSESNKKSKLRYFWEDHKFTVVLVSCLVLPFIFIPVWIVVFTVARIRRAFGRPDQPRPADALSDSAIAPARSVGDPGTREPKPGQVGSYVGVVFSGFAAIAGAMLCALGAEVIGLASGKPGGGIALLMGYCLVGGGVISLIIGIAGITKGVRRQDG